MFYRNLFFLPCFLSGLLIGVLCSYPALADLTNSKSKLPPPLSYSWQRVGNSFLVPVKQPARHSLLIGSALTGLLIITRNETVDPLQTSLVTRKPLGPKWADFGDHMGQLIPNIIYAGGMGIYGYFSDSEKSYSRAAFMIEATTYSGLSTMMLKVIAQERRPNGGDRKSFPSGHSTTAFAFATAVAMEHSWYYSVPAFALAGLVGVSRINDNAHYLHDVTFGATLGIAYAIGIHHLHYTNKKKALETSRSSKIPKWTAMSLAPASKRNSDLLLLTSHWIF